MSLIISSHSLSFKKEIELRFLNTFFDFLTVFSMKFNLKKIKNDLLYIWKNMK